MARRFTITEKWGRPWFMKLKPRTKLMWYYLYDSCDVAGFWEVNLELACFQTKMSEDDTKLAFEELKEAYIREGRYIWLINFIKDQKNLPLNRRNAAHRGIVAILNSHPDFYEHTKILLDPAYCETPLFHDAEGPIKGLVRGLGKGKGKGNRGSGGERKMSPADVATEAKRQKEMLFK